MDSLATLLEEITEHLSNFEGRPGREDISRAIRCAQIARGRLDMSPVNRASRLLYQEMESWATFEKGTVRPEVIVQLLAEEGLLRDERENDNG